MKRWLIFLLLAVATGAWAQAFIPASPGASDVRTIRRLMAQLEYASSRGDARTYAAIFADDAKWLGLDERQANGPAAIQRNIETMFRTFGPLVSRGWDWGCEAKAIGRTQIGSPRGWGFEAKPGPDVAIMTLYQSQRRALFALPESPDSFFGNPDRKLGGCLETTLGLEKHEGRWEAVRARLRVTMSCNMRVATSCNVVYLPLR
jgi:hypothetical protein